MDLQTAMKPSGRKWQLTRLVAVMFLIGTCGLLTLSLLTESAMGVAQDQAPSWAMR
ncbi:MAG: hypothetical protein AB7L90_14875 [Hyphomicrobiaceae bacterium]